MIKSLQSLRAFGAIMIFIHHFGFDNCVLLSFGDCVVNWFMMLSGFVLCAAHENKPGLPDLKSFMTKRLRHILPFYFIALALMVCMRLQYIEAAPLAASALLIQSWIPYSGYYFAYNSPAWFISDIMLCYLLFLPLLRLMTRTKHAIAKFTAVIAMAYLSVLLLVKVDSSTEFWLFYIFPVMQLPSFVMGMVLWQVVKYLKGTSTPFKGNLLLIIAITAAVACMIAYKYVPERLQLSLYWWPTTALLLLIFTLTDKCSGFMTRLLHTPLLLTIGNASMIFYLLHLPWIRATRLFLETTGIDLPKLVELPLSLTLFTALTLILHRFITRRKGSADISGGITKKS